MTAFRIIYHDGTTIDCVAKNFQDAYEIVAGRHRKTIISIKPAFDED